MSVLARLRLLLVRYLPLLEPLAWRSNWLRLRRLIATWHRIPAPD